MKQLASAIAAAHAAGVVHRDLKPENILLASPTDDTSLKIADLGFAKIAQGKNMMLTTPCGTPGYVAPEVISGKPYAAGCDVWSLGVILYILLVGCVCWRAGRARRRRAIISRCPLPPPPPSPRSAPRRRSYPPFVHDNQEELFKLVRNGDFSMTSSGWPQISPPAKDLVSRMLTVEPARRITAEQVMSHPWITLDAALVPNNKLAAAHKEIKRLQARRRL